MSSKLSEELREGAGRVPLEVFVANELHTDTIFSCIYSPSNTIKIENYPLSLEVSKEDLGGR